MKLKLFLLSLLFYGVIFSQDKCDVVVYDVMNYHPVYNAVVMALSPKGQKIYSYDRTTGLGRATFNFSEQVDSFKIWVLHPKFVSFKSSPKACKEGKIVDTLFVYPQSRVLRRVFVRQNRAVTIKGDTIRYVADSFKMPPGASVEELLKNLPGLEVDENGAIKAQGKEVTKVLVDGDDFFGNDMTIATKNLDANMIDEVEVIDAENKKSQATGVSDGEKEKIINLKLKKEYKNGYFGKLQAGATNTERDDLFGMANVFSEYNKLSIYGKSSNMNTRIGWEDKRNLGIQNVWYYDESLDMWTNRQNNSIQIDEIGVIPREYQTGAYYKRKFMDETGELSVRFNQNRKEYNGRQRMAQTIFFDSSSRVSNTQKNIDAATDNYFTTIGFEKRLDSFHKIYLSMDYNSFTADGILGSVSELSIDSVLVNQFDRSNQYDKTAQSFKVSGTLDKKFRKKGRFLGLNSQFSTSNIKESTLNTLTGELYSGGITIPQILDQKMQFVDKNNELKVSATYIEPLKKQTYTIEPSVSMLYNFNASNRNTFEKNNAGKYEVLNPQLSNNYDYDLLVLSQKLKLNYNTKKWNLTIGGAMQESSLFQKNIDSGEVDVRRNFVFFLPEASANWKYKRNSNAILKFTTFVNPPEINRLQPFVNNLNPTYITVGNPSLKPSYTYKISLRNNFWYAISKKSLWMNLSFRWIKDDFANDVTQDENGVITNRYTQVDGNYSFNSNVHYSFRFKPLDVKLGTGINYRMNKTAQLFNSQQFDVNNHSVYPNFSIRKKIDSFMSFRLFISPSFTSSTSDNPSFTNNSNFRSDISNDITFFLPKKFELTSNVGWNYIPANDLFPTDQSFVIWSAELKKNFMKSNQLSASLKVYDILGQNQSLNRFFFQNRITEQFSDVLTRYVMLSATWKFKNKSKNDEDNL